jgi:hypothetical protein
VVMLHKQIHSTYKLLNGQIEQAKAAKHCTQSTQSFGDIAKYA